MQNFFVGASDTFKPFFFSFQNPFTALLKGQAGDKSAKQQRLATIASLQRMARDVEYSQPNLAAELRYFASRS